MKSRTLPVIALAAAITVAAIVAVFAFRGAETGTRSTEKSGVTIVAPDVRVETDPVTGKTSVQAPFTDVEKDTGGTHVEAPGVDVDQRKSEPD